MWTLASAHHHEAHTPTHGYEAPRAAAMAAFAKSWRRGAGVAAQRHQSASSRPLLADGDRERAAAPGNY